MDAQAAGVIAPLGVEIAFLVAGLGAAVIAAVVGIETQRNPFVLAIVSFFAMLIVAHAVHAVL
jgi:flagellar biosynthesis protein FliQ